MFHVVILEKDSLRINRFFAAISSNTSDIVLTARRTEREFIDSHLVCQRKPDLLALNIIQGQSSSETNARAGYEVARFLADCDPICPVLIHSDDHATANAMVRVLLDGGWVALQFRTGGSDWIETHWYPYVRKLLVAN